MFWKTQPTIVSSLGRGPEEGPCSACRRPDASPERADRARLPPSPSFAASATNCLRVMVIYDQPPVGDLVVELRTSSRPESSPLLPPAIPDCLALDRSRCQALHDVTPQE